MKKPFECKECNEFFDDRKKLKKHQACVHDKKKFYKCDFCDATFSKKFSIKFHISSVHEKKKPFTCDLCDKKFPAKFHLKLHKQALHEEKKFECHICKLKVAEKYTLKRHIESVHDKIKPFKCEICHHECVKKFELKAHMSSGDACMKALVKQERLIKEENKNFSCPKCERKFSSEKILNFHVLFYHEFKVPNSCSICDLMFWTKKVKLVKRLSLCSFAVHSLGKYI